MSLKERIDEIKERYEARKTEIDELIEIIKEHKIKLDDLKKARKQYRGARKLLKKSCERRWWDDLEKQLDSYGKGLQQFTALGAFEKMAPADIAALKTALEALDGPLSTLWKTLIPVGIGLGEVAAALLTTDPKKTGAIEASTLIIPLLIPLAANVLDVKDKLDEHVKGKIPLPVFVHAEIGEPGWRSDTGAFLTTFVPAAFEIGGEVSNLLDNWKKQRKLRSERRKALAKLRDEIARAEARTTRNLKRAREIEILGKTLVELEQTGTVVLHLGI